MNTDSGVFILLQMTSAPEKLDDRAVFYKHSDSNFYPALSYVIGQALALVPQMLLDVLLFGTFVYWLVGFVATANGFIMYLALFFSFNFMMGQLFGLLAAVGPSKTVVQAGGAVILLLNTLFCGEHLILLLDSVEVAHVLLSSRVSHSLRIHCCPNCHTDILCK